MDFIDLNDPGDLENSFIKVFPMMYLCQFGQNLAIGALDTHCVYTSHQCKHLRLVIFVLILLSPCFFKKASGILQSPPSVRLSGYLILNHWMKSNQIWCVGCSHEWGLQWHIFFCPAPCGPWEGTKRSNIITEISLNLN